MALGLTLTLGLVPASVAAGQGSTTDGMHNATRLGGSTAFYSPPLRTAESLKQMAARRGMAEDIRSVLGESGIPETADAVLATLAGATSSVAGGLCDQATPPDGTVVACDVQPGSTLLWMAYRPNAGKGIRTPGRIERVRWSGAKAFRALLFRVTNDNRIYTFVMPMECANVSLMSVKEVEGAPIELSVDRWCDPNTGVLRATVKAAGKDLGRVQRVRVAINGQPAGELTAPSWTLVSDKPGNYTFEATDTRGRPYPVAPRSIPVEACPPLVKAPQVVGPTCSVVLSYVPVKGAYEITMDAGRSTTGASGVAPEVTIEVRDAAGAVVGEKLTLDSSLSRKITVRRPGSYRATATVTTPQGTVVGGNRYEGSATCEADVLVEKGGGGTGGAGGAAGMSGLVPFFDVLGGKERRVRPIEDTDLDYAQCSPLLGLKFGIAKRFQNDWEVAGALGAAISLVSSDNKVGESALFLDAEANKYMGGGSFIGTGLSLWDLTRGDTLTPAWLLHFGLPLAKNARYPVFFIGEGRLFFDHIDDVSSNYLLWAGIRVHLQRR